MQTAFQHSHVVQWLEKAVIDNIKGQEVGTSKNLCLHSTNFHRELNILQVTLLTHTFTFFIPRTPASVAVLQISRSWQLPELWQNAQALSNHMCIELLMSCVQQSIDGSLRKHNIFHASKDP